MERVTRPLRAFPATANQPTSERSQLQHMAVFVLDKRKQPLMPCSEKRARLLLERNKAVVHRRYPFTIRLKDRVGGKTQPVRLKLDPGSRVTGIAVVRQAHGGCGQEEQKEEAPDQRNEHVLLLAELTHRGHHISQRLTARRAFRHSRRSRKTRYRAPRFSNRCRRKGWLPPSLGHRLNTTASWVRRIRTLTPVSAISIETARFDTQKLEDPEINGVEYQQGELAGYELREYLLEKWVRKCAYCSVEGVALQIDHIYPRSRGGSDRVANLTLACPECNQRKGSGPVEKFLAREPVRLQRILAKAKAPLSDAAAVNATRWALYNAMAQTGLEVELSTGGRTKYNRSRMSIPNSHANDAACVGRVDDVRGWESPVLAIKAMGRRTYCRTRLTRQGGIRGYLTRHKRHFGFQTGDMVRARVPTGKKAGTHIGRVAIRASGSFNIQTAGSVVEGISHHHCQLLQRTDGYRYSIVAHSRERSSGGGAALGAARYPSPAFMPGSPAQTDEDQPAEQRMLRG